MKRHIEIVIGGKRYRFLIDDELDKELNLSLKERYRFNSDNVLTLNDEDLANSYQTEQLILKAILKQISTYDLTPDLEKRIDTLKKYVGNRTTVYNSDLSKLQSVLGEAGEIYSSIRSTLQKKKIEQSENVKESVEEIHDTIQRADYKNDNISGTVSSTDDKLEEFKAIIEEISYDEELKDMVPVKDINEAIDRVVICSSMEEFIDKTSSKVVSYDVINAIKNKGEKIVLPPNTKLEDAVVEILKSCINDKVLIDKVVTYVERKVIYKNKTDAAFEALRSSLKMSGLTPRNLNYFGDQFFTSFESICNESGMSFEAMFADYFNSYSTNRKYNSPMDKFIRLYNMYNGGDDNTRALLETMLVKKAISRGLISHKYNNYLKDEYRNLSVNSGGYINFHEQNSQNIKSGISSEAHSINIASDGHLGTNSDSYKSDFNSQITPRTEEDSLNKHSKEDKNNFDLPDVMSDSAILNSNLINKRKNIVGGGVVQASATGGIVNETVTSTRSLTGLNGRRFASNTSLNPVLISEEEKIQEDDDGEENKDTDISDKNATSDDNLNVRESSGELDSDGGLDETSDKSSDAGGNLVNTAQDAIKDAAKKGAKKAIVEFIKKNPWTWLVIGILIFLLFLFLIIIASSNDNKNNELGYYDTACNFNDATVSIVGCENSNTLQSLELKDYVIRMAYLYIKDNNYSDEAIKALMIILKTNALSIGGYSSGNKSLNVKICDVYNGAVNEADLFEGIDEKLGDLTNLYEQVSEYLFISSSYKSTISSLSKVNAITIGDSTMSSLESEASNGANYSEILASVFKVETEESITINTANENLFLGDSRTQGMLLTSVINENNTVYGVGYGYNWLVGNSGFTGTTNALNGGINALNAKMVSGKSYNIIIWLGVNDLGNTNRYLEKYKELASGEWSRHNIYIVSVGPVQDSKSVYAKNATINSFNDTMKNGISTANLSNLKYIDLGYTEDSIKTYDRAGLHYGSEDYKKIYNIITSNLGSNGGPNVISTKRELYKLSDYCSFYTLTENDAYWWPIGSSNPEPENSNIYGGTPINNTITSNFGARLDPFTGKPVPGHGALDIAVPRNTPIIATKNGTVVFTNTGCVEGVLTCGGSYGNYVKIDHGDGVESLYAHLNSLAVKNGDVVKQGQIIGYSGSTGRSTGPHLHFEIRLNGAKVDPLGYVDKGNPRPVNFPVSDINGFIKVIGDNGDYSDNSKNKSIVCNSLRASGFSENAVIGILTNMQRESAGTFSPQIVEYGSGYNFSTIYKAPASVAAGFGIIQWSFGRRINLINYAKENNVDPASLVAQLNFFYKEVTEYSSYAVTKKYITGSYSGYDTAVALCKNFERPRGSVRDLTIKDSCTTRADSIVPSMTTYVKNGCK